MGDEVGAEPFLRQEFAQGELGTVGAQAAVGRFPRIDQGPRPAVKAHNLSQHQQVPATQQA